MTFSHTLFVLLLCILTGSYAWGMRGTIIGGERGAMLPGAALALVLLYSGGSLPVATAFPMAATIGAAGMFFGGSQTYGETIALSHDSDPKIRRYGMIGLAIKGAGWFGIFGGILGFGFGAMAGRYSLSETIIFVLVIPVARRLGILLLNSPYKPKANIFPKLYFSKSRREVWGGMVLIFLHICIFVICKGEWFALLLALFGAVFGALGFCAGDLLYRLFEEHLSKTWFSGWKAMECTFGALGALGVGLCWCMFYGVFGSRYAYEITAHSGAWSPFSNQQYALLGFIWLVLFGLFIVRYWFPRQGGKRSGKLSAALYRAEDTLIYPVFCLYPLFLSAVGDLFFAQIFCFFGMLYLLPDKIFFGGKRRNPKTSLETILYIVLILLSVVVLFAQLLLELSPGVYPVWLVYTVVYLLVMYVTALSTIQEHTCKQQQESSVQDTALHVPEPSWLIYAGVCVVALSILGKIYYSL